MADFLNATKRPVYYRVGKKDSKARFIKAPFDFIVLDGVQYVSSVGLGDNLVKAFDGILNSGTTEDSEAGYQERFSDNGWVDEMIYLEPHEMGDVQNDNWKSVHSFGLL